MLDEGDYAPRWAASAPRNAKATSALATQLAVRATGSVMKEVARRGTAAPAEKLRPPSGGG